MSSTPAYVLGDSSVYEPSEDTFLLLDALAQDVPAQLAHWITLNHHRNHNQNENNNHNHDHDHDVTDSEKKPGCREDVLMLRALEIGCGSGLPIVHLGQLVKSYHQHDGTPSPCQTKVHCITMATDINENAAQTAVNTGRLNGVSLHVVQTDLVRGLERGLEQGIDLLLFNPPYVVTPSEEIASSLAARAWAGGIDGREVIDRFLPFMHSLLSPTGCCYLLLLDQNKPQQVMHIMRHSYLFSSKIILSRKAGREKLHIVKFWREQQQPEQPK